MNHNNIIETKDCYYDNNDRLMMDVVDGVKNDGRDDDDDDVIVAMGGGTDENDERIGTKQQQQQKTKTKCCCDPYYGNVDAIGLSYLASGRGMLIMSNITMSQSLLWLAKNAAGCFEDENTENVPCDKSVYGMMAESFVTNIATISAVLSALFMPICGAIVDYTHHRKTVGIITAIIMISIQVIQIGTVESTWFLMGILQAIAAFVYQLQLVVLFAYLPDVSRIVGQKKMTNISTNLSAVQYVSSTSFLIIITAIRIGINSSDVVTSQISQGLNSVTSLVTFGIGWFRYLTSRPAARTLPEGKSLLLEGFRQNWNTAKSIQKYYKNGLRWFLLAVVFAEASATAITTVSIVYLSSTIQLDGTEVGIFFIITLLSISIGTIWGQFITNKTNPNLSWKISMAYLFVVLMAGALILDDLPSDYKNLSYVWAVTVGLGLGWYYPTENLFFSMCLPIGNEAEFSGFFIYCGQILGWLFPLIFSLLIENNVSQKYGVIVVATGFLIGICSLSCTTFSWEDILNEVNNNNNNNNNNMNHNNTSTTVPASTTTG